MCSQRFRCRYATIFRVTPHSDHCDQDMFVLKLRIFVFLFVICVISATLCVLFLSYHPEKVRWRSGFSSFQTSLRKDKARNSLRNLERGSHVKIHKFNVSGHDVMIFVHIQKTSGTHFGYKLEKNLLLEKSCTLMNRR